MKISFLILAHKNAGQCALLIDCLLTLPKATAIIHVDLKAEEVYASLLKRYAGNSRVRLLSARHAVYWGNYGQVMATAELIKSANTNGSDYCCLLSGQDLPVKPLTAFSRFLETNNGKEFLENKPLPAADWEGEGGLNRVNLYWPSLKSRTAYFSNKLHGLLYHLQLKSGFRRRLKYKYYGGSNWFTLSAKAITVVCNYLEQNPGYLKSFRYTRCADELFVQSILMNSELSNAVVSENLRLVDWVTGPEFPRIFRQADFDTLLNARDKFFARKFDMETDETVVHRLAQHAGLDTTTTKAQNR